MKMVILDETVKECKKNEAKNGDVLGHIIDAPYEKHIYIAALPVSASGMDSIYQRIGRWEICQPKAAAAENGLELYLNPVSDELAAFYKGQRLEDIQIANYRTDFSARIQGIVDWELLTGKSVLIIGAGSVGSKMAMHLVRAGVGKFIIIDFDRVETANLCRCEYSVRDVGRYKSLALRDRLMDVNPFAEVETYQMNVKDMGESELVDLISRSHLVVSAADDPAVEQWLNSLAHSLLPVVYPGLYSRASAGEVIFTLPGGPCYQCIVGSLRSASNIPSRGQWDYTTAGALKAEPGLGIDIDYVVAIASKIALALLMLDVQGSEVAKIIDRGRTAVFASNVAQVMYGIAFEPFGVVWAQTKLNEDCVACRAKEFNSELLSRVQSQIAALVQSGSSWLFEHGGIKGEGEI